MKPSLRSPYLYLACLLVVAVFIQAVILGELMKEQFASGNSSGALVYISFFLGLLFTGLASLCYLRSTKKERTLRNQLLFFLVVPIMCIPVIGFMVTFIILIPLYGSVGTQ